ncbi:hypothetical protein AAT19DRAFT_14145 [Rhodotorula toruloides]|uniref:Uncharacterized protein n=1 Tax=Rhodotorula toruloides TaxID=5286 RepID=A0A2T0AAT4_RHOTO|nr:hypothetical protein AAT19DRAFT_14145 [Rhodotorula toruloides]
MSLGLRTEAEKIQGTSTNCLSARLPTRTPSPVRYSSTSPHRNATSESGSNERLRLCSGWSRLCGQCGDSYQRTGPGRMRGTAFGIAVHPHPHRQHPTKPPDPLRDVKRGQRTRPFSSLKQRQDALVCFGCIPSSTCWFECAMRPPVSVAGRVLVALAVAESCETLPPDPTMTGSWPFLGARSWAVGITAGRERRRQVSCRVV